MAAGKKALEKRKKVLKALRELKSTHSLKEISQKIDVHYFNVKRIYKFYCEKITRTPETIKRLHGGVNRSNKHPNEVCEKVVALKKQGLNFSQIGKELNIPSNSASAINYRLTTKPLEVASKEELEEEQNKWGDEKLVSKYAAKGEYDWLPMFFIRSHHVTHSTAKQIYLQLQALKRKQHHETPTPN